MLSFTAYLHWAKTTSLSEEFFKFNVPFILSGVNDQRKFSFTYSLSISVKTPLQSHFYHDVWPCTQGFTVIQCTHLYDVQHASVVVSKLFLVEETPFLVLGCHRFHATLPVFALQHDRLKAYADEKTLPRVNVLTLLLTVNESTSSLREFLRLLKWNDALKTWKCFWKTKVKLGFLPQIKVNTIFNQILTSNSKQKSQVVYLFLWQKWNEER